jgi:hypothetical protein
MLHWSFSSEAAFVILVFQREEIFEICKEVLARRRLIDGAEKHLGGESMGVAAC